MNKTDGVADFG